jgi:chromosome segregation ATPase
MKFFAKKAEEEKRLREKEEQLTVKEELLNTKAKYLKNEELSLSDLSSQLKEEKNQIVEENSSLDKKKNRLQDLETVFKNQKNALTMLQEKQLSSDYETLEAIIIAHINERFGQLTPDHKQTVLNEAFDLMNTKTNEFVDEQ